MVSFHQDGTFEGVRTLDPAEPDNVGDIVFAPGDEITVTGEPYDADEGCGSYG